MMSKFKVGDRVKLIRSVNGVDLGTLGTVADVEFEYYCIHVIFDGHKYPTEKGYHGMSADEIEHAIDYNDGKWHGWLGGACPVHPEEVVEIKVSGGWQTTKKASELYWTHNIMNGDIIAFRVITPYAEPVVTEYNGVCWAYPFTDTSPKTASYDSVSRLGDNCIPGTWTAKHVDGKLQSFTWTADK